MIGIPEYQTDIGFEHVPPDSIEIKISFKESRDFRIRMWLMKQVTRVYFWILARLSKGATVGVMEL
jgi:hypothetical protein